MFAFQKYKFRHFNFKLLLYIIFLSVMGILIIRSATLSTGEESTYTKQIMGVAIGMAKKEKAVAALSGVDCVSD